MKKNKKSTTRPILIYVISILVCLGAGWLGSLFTTPAIPIWYAALKKPFFTPPSWLFAPVWSFLYICMGVACAMIWQMNIAKKNVRDALEMFGVQLMFNIFWSIVFFGMHSIAGGLIVIILLWGTLLLTIRRFYQLSNPAGALLIPYILWVSFATVLNAAIWIINT